eukprot:1572749-Rhodomonas_salina.1
MPTYFGRGVHRYVSGEPAPHVCTGPDSEAHHFNVASGLECIPGSCRNCALGSQTFPELYTLPSHIAGAGLFVKSNVRKGTFVAEVSGDVINHYTFMNRMGSYETAGAWEHLAIFQLRGMSAFIDATDPERRSLA